MLAAAEREIAREKEKIKKWKSDNEKKLSLEIESKLTEIKFEHSNDIERLKSKFSELMMAKDAELKKLTSEVKLKEQLCVQFEELLEKQRRDFLCR